MPPCIRGIHATAEITIGTLQKFSKLLKSGCITVKTRYFKINKK